MMGTVRVRGLQPMAAGSSRHGTDTSTREGIPYRPMTQSSIQAIGQLIADPFVDIQPISG